MPPFTDKQGQYLTFIHLYTKINGRPPAETDLARYFGVSAPSAHQMVAELVRKGLIAKVPGAPRSLQVLLDPAELPALL